MQLQSSIQMKRDFPKWSHLATTSWLDTRLGLLLCYLEGLLQLPEWCLTFLLAECWVPGDPLEIWHRIAWNLMKWWFPKRGSLVPVVPFQLLCYCSFGVCTHTTKTGRAFWTWMEHVNGTWHERLWPPLPFTCKWSNPHKRKWAFIILERFVYYGDL